MGRLFITKPNQIISVDHKVDRHFILVCACLLIVILLGTLFRVHNLSPYLFYPDSYQNLLVSENIQNQGSVVGTLGKGGMTYPSFFMWTRPIYPLLILISNVFIHNISPAAFTSLIMGILAIPLSYLFIKTVFSSSITGLAAALLTAISFNHTVWSGFIMSETTGIVFTLLYLTCLFTFIKRQTNLADWRDLATGIILALTVFSRYEYILYIIVTIFIVVFSSTKPLYKLTNIFVSFLFTASIIFTSLFPVTQTLLAITYQTNELMIVSLGMVICCVITLCLVKRNFTLVKDNLINIRKNKGVHKFLKYLFIGFGVFTLSLPFTKTEPVILGGVFRFAKDDFLLISLSFIGIGLLIRQNWKLTVLVLIGIIQGEIIYYRINPLMQRYTLHLLPFLLIPASYALNIIVSHVLLRQGIQTKIFLRQFSILIFIIFLSLQIKTSYTGLHSWNKGIWFIKSYEEHSAINLGEYLQADDILIASLPEPYYFFTNNSTIGVSTDYPYLYLENIPEDSDLVIVNDLAMTYLFPDFSHFITTNLSVYKLTSYRVSVPYRYQTDIELPKSYFLVDVYRIKKSELIGKFH